MSHLPAELTPTTNPIGPEGAPAAIVADPTIGAVPALPSRRPLAAVVAVGILAVLAAGVVPALAGPYDEEIAAARSGIADRQTTIAEGHAHIADLEARLVDLDQQIGEAEGRIGMEDHELALLPVRIELLADRFIEVLASQDEPTTLQQTMAVDAYVRNDERINDVLTQSAQLTEDGLANVRDRMLYDSVIEEAQRRIELVRAELRLTAEEVVGLRSLVDAAQSRRQAELASQSDIEGAKPAVRTEIEEVRRLIAATETEIDGLEAEIQRFERMAITRTWTGVQGEDVGRPALAVKVDNVTRAHPQSGVNQADVVYEELVEGGVTRLVAVFQSTSADMVGPVRSARTSDPPLLEGFDRPLFSYSGANRGTRSILRQSTLTDVGYSAQESDYWRDRSRRPPHNLYTGTDRLWAHHADRTSVPPAPFVHRYPGQALHPEAKPATGVSIDFGLTEVDYDWNGTGWARTHNEKAHVDANGIRIAPANVVVQFIRYGRSTADLRSPEAITEGSGEAWLFTDGHVVRGQWRRLDASRPATFTANGEEVRLSVGTTWVALAKQGTAEIRD